jgi:excinuclease ABC subunit C
MPGFRFEPECYPVQPGCYLLKDARGQVLYVGKAKNLRRRLASYFQPSRQRGRNKRLVRKVAAIEVVLLHTETESFLYESRLIARYRPPFNRAFWRADNGFPYIALTAEAFPRFVPYSHGAANFELGAAPVARRFGPYVSRRFRDGVLAFVNDHFQLRTCDPLPQALCLRYHMHKCCGVCAEAEATAAYARGVEQAAALLDGAQHTELLREMRRRMWAHAERLEFEQAARLKTRVEVLERALARQVVERELACDQDVIYFGQGRALVAAVRAGVLQTLELLDGAPPAEEDGAAFLLARYRESAPPELIANRVADPGGLAAALSAANRRPVRLVVPAGGAEQALLELCRLNYEYRAGERQP